jgi:putative transposase
VIGQSRRFLLVLDDVHQGTTDPGASEVDGKPRHDRLLEEALLWHGEAQAIRSDKGAELNSAQLITWTHDQSVNHFLIQPSRPMQNGMVESLNGKMRDEFLNENGLLHLTDACKQAERFMKDRNTDRRHSSLG